MTEETPTPTEEVATTPQDGSESEDTSFDELFGSSEDDSDEQDATKKLESRLDRIEKGLQKAFSNRGREKQNETPKETPKEKATPTSAVMKSLYFKANPEAVEVWDEVEKAAAETGKDPFELYENSSFFKNEAKSKAEAKRVEEENKSRVGAPTGGGGASGTIPFDQIDLNNKTHTDWLKADPKRVGDYNEWLKLNYKKVK